MMLSIELMSKDTVETVLTHEANKESMTVQEESSTTVIEESMTVPEESSLTVLNDEEIQTIIDDLREDPDIANFMDNFDFEFDNCPLW